MIHPERIGHVVIKVRDLERSRKFYTEVLGMQVMKDVPQIGACFLANNGRDHHEVALFQVGPQAAAPKGNEIGLLHFAFRLRSEEELRAAYQEFKAGRYFFRERPGLTWTFIVVWFISVGSGETLFALRYLV